MFRLNMSHGSHDDVRKRHEIIREVEKDCGRPIAILADLQGPKIRCGQFADGSEEDYMIPAEVWRRNGEKVTKLFIFSRQLTGIELDPLHQTADVDRSNRLNQGKN